MSMEKFLRKWELHDRIFSTSVVLANLFYNDGCLYQLSNYELLDRDDYKYIGFGEDNIIVDDAEGKSAITGVFLWGDCSIAFRVAPAEAPEVVEFVCWSDYDEDMLEKIVNNLKNLL